MKGQTLCAVLLAVLSLSRYGLAQAGVFEESGLPPMAGLPKFGVTYSLDRLVADLERAGVTEMEDALPLLPEALRASFTLQYEGGVEHGHGLQGADPRRPRAILFTDDGKFMLTFTGDSSQSRGDRWEILQYVEAPESRTGFELYDLKFPLKREAKGHVTRPALNPAECLACHRSDPRPNWGPYQDWPGIFSEDMSQKNPHYNDLMTFLTHRGSHPRYRNLLPPGGMLTSPFRNDDLPPEQYLRPAFKFQPNTRLMNTIVRLNSRRIADRFRKSPYYADLLPLLVLTLDRDINYVFSDSRKIIPGVCGDPDHPQPKWGWTEQDIRNANQQVLPLLTQLYGAALPYPSDAPLSSRNVLAALGVHAGDLFPSITRAGIEPNLESGQDFLSAGGFHRNWIVSSQHYWDFAKLYGGLFNHSFALLIDPWADEHSFQIRMDPEQLTLDYDLPHVRYWDGLGIFSTIDRNSNCRAIYSLAREHLAKLSAFP